MGLAGVAVGAFLRVALGRAAGVLGVVGVAGGPEKEEDEGRAGVKAERGGRASSSESLRLSTADGLRAVLALGLDSVDAFLRREGVAMVEVRRAMGVSLRGVGSLRNVVG